VLVALLAQPLAVVDAAFVGARAAPRSMRARATAPAMSFNTLPPVPVAAIESATTLLARKSEADELIEEIFITFPVVFAGLLLGFFIVEYVKKQQERLDIEALNIVFEDYFVFAAVPAFTLAFVAASKVGILGTGSGLLAKGLLDGWNVFAGVALPGALLKY